MNLFDKNEHTKINEKRMKASLCLTLLYFVFI